MRQALVSKGVVVHAMLCGLQKAVFNGIPEDVGLFVEATIDKADLAKALAAGPFTEVTAQTEDARSLQGVCPN